MDGAVYNDPEKLDALQSKCEEIVAEDEHFRAIYLHRNYACVLGPEDSAKLSTAHAGSTAQAGSPSELGSPAGLASTPTTPHAHK